MNKATFSIAGATANERNDMSGFAACDAREIRDAEFGTARPILASSEARALVARRGEAAWSDDYRTLVAREVFHG